MNLPVRSGPAESKDPGGLVHPGCFYSTIYPKLNLSKQVKNLPTDFLTVPEDNRVKGKSVF